MSSIATFQPRRRLALARRIYFARVIVLSLGFLCVGSVIYELQLAPVFWVYAALQCFIWPHIAYRLDLSAEQSNRAAMRTLMLDSLMVGLWLPIMQFNMLCGAAIIAMTAMSNVGIGGIRCLWRGVLAQIAGVALGIVLFGFRLHPFVSQFNIIATLPLILCYPIAIGAFTYRLSQRLSQQRDKLDHLSKHDGLSGLFNRMHWEVLIADEFARGQRQRTPAAIILTDIDFFKAINDCSGHAAGDAVIKRFADLLRANVREIDRAARYGGEEFAILMPNTTLPEAIDAAERLRVMLEFGPLGGMRVTASFGVAELQNTFSDCSAWVQCADAALYRAKAAGRNCVIAYTATHQNQSAQH